MIKMLLKRIYIDFFLLLIEVYLYHTKGGIMSGGDGI